MNLGYCRQFIRLVGLEDKRLVFGLVCLRDVISSKNFSNQAYFTCLIFVNSVVRLTEEHIYSHLTQKKYLSEAESRICRRSVAYSLQKQRRETKGLDEIPAGAPPFFLIPELMFLY